MMPAYLDCKAALLCLGLTFLAPVTFAEAFGVASWGENLMSIRDQEQRPNLTPMGETDYLVYQASLPGIDETRLVYQFNDRQLTTGRFLFTARQGSPVEDWIDQFRTVRSLISQQYGEPVRQQVLQPAGAAPIEPSGWAAALRNDTLILKSYWQTETTILIQQLTWNGNRPHHQIIYRPTSTADASAVESVPF
jgi:hypothetical protein